jgi:hypothetical protein
MDRRYKKGGVRRAPPFLYPLELLLNRAGIG